MTLSPNTSRMLSKTAYKKSAPAVVGGKRVAPTAGTTPIPCSPLDPASADTLTRPELGSPYIKYETFVTDTTIGEGDILTVDGTDYAVRCVDDWEHNGDHLVHLVVEDEQSHE